MIFLFAPLCHSVGVNRASPASIRFVTVSSASAQNATPTGYSPL